MSRIIVAVLIGLLLGLWEICVSPFLPNGLPIHVVVPGTVLLIVASRRSRAFVAAFVAGLMIDVYSVSVFDLASLRFLLVAFCLEALATHVFTNRSLYSALALALVGRLLERFLAYGIGSLFTWFLQSQVDWHGTAAWPLVIISDGILVGFGFLLMLVFTRRFLIKLPVSRQKGGWL